MNEINAQPKRKHDLILKSRKNMSIDGVENVVSFDETQIELVTTCGEMVIEGQELHISTLDLDSGVVELDGKVEGVFYSDVKTDNKERGFFARLFG